MKRLLLCFAARLTGAKSGALMPGIAQEIALPLQE